MTPDQLRELADRLSDPCSPDDDDLETVADFLRQCAEAKPVAWLHDVVQDGDEPDEALSFYPDSFPLENVGGFRSIGCKPLFAAPAAPQAEPKREPLSDGQLDAAFQTAPEALLALVSGETTVGAFKTALRRLARAVERAHGIGGSDER